MAGVYDGNLFVLKEDSLFVVFNLLIVNFSEDYKSCVDMLPAILSLVIL